MIKDNQVQNAWIKKTDAEGKMHENDLWWQK